MNKTISFSINTKLIVGLVLVFSLGLGLGWWQPWTDDVVRTIEVTGTTELEAEPDSYTFRPTIEVEADTQQEAKEQSSQLGDKLAQQLIEAGVPENNITSESYQYPAFGEDTYTAYYSLVVEVDSEELSQQVYDILIANEAVTNGADPNSTLSTKKQNELKKTARAQAIEDARDQAEASANELGLEVGEVVSVEEQDGNNFFPTISSGIQAASRAEDSNFYAGDEKLNFSVVVTFELH